MLEFISDLLESPDRIPWVQALPAMQANFRADTENRGVYSAPEQFFDFFLHQFAAANRAFWEWRHEGVLLSRQLTHRCGSGRYTVISTAHLFFMYTPKRCGQQYR